MNANKVKKINLRDTGGDGRGKEEEEGKSREEGEVERPEEKEGGRRGRREGKLRD